MADHRSEDTHERAWPELATSEAKKARAFYTELLGLAVVGVATDAGRYDVLLLGDAPVAGIRAADDASTGAWRAVAIDALDAAVRAALDARPRAPVDTLRAPSGGAAMEVRVASLEDVRLRAVRLGANVIVARSDAQDGARATIIDPTGARVVLFAPAS